MLKLCSKATIKAFCIQLINLSCLVGFQNYMARHSVALKDRVASFEGQGYNSDLSCE